MDKIKSEFQNTYSKQFLISERYFDIYCGQWCYQIQHVNTNSLKTFTS